MKGRILKLLIANFTHVRYIYRKNKKKFLYFNKKCLFLSFSFLFFSKNGELSFFNFFLMSSDENSVSRN